MAARIGHKKALLAIGHKILCAIYHMLKNGQPYQAPDTERIQKKLQEKQLGRYLEKIKHLGYEVQLTIATT
jgi:transposase